MCSKRPSPNLAGLYAFVGLRTRRILTLNLTRMVHLNQRTARASVRAARLSLSSAMRRRLMP
jgi:hypothetical protein